MAILIVDHEAYRIQSLARGLRTKGYEVLEARTLSETLGCVAAQGVRIDLVITDCSTRILSSPEMLEALHERFPDAQVVTMTERGEWLQESSPLPWPTHFLNKPFTNAELICLVESLCPWMRHS